MSCVFSGDEESVLPFLAFFMVVELASELQQNPLGRFWMLCREDLGDTWVIIAWKCCFFWRLSLGDCFACLWGYLLDESIENDTGGAVKDCGVVDNASPGRTDGADVTEGGGGEYSFERGFGEYALGGGEHETMLTDNCFGRWKEGRTSGGNE